uniref:Uncharacterized protein n=1 Tax=Vespula pensylvanica TaxID=30213 RepID=A0A834N2C8_VESPE|nr:hypothetical protein H0235_017463 [Vespula pensylvanica]
MLNEQAGQNQYKPVDKMKRWTRSGIRYISDVEVEDIAIKLGQKELLLQERKGVVREREKALRVRAVKPEVIPTQQTMHITHCTRGRAYSIVEDFNIYSSDKLCNILCGDFVRNRSSQQSRTELNGIYIGQDERILIFMDRLRIISNVCEDLLDTFVKARQSYMEEDLNRFDNMITSNHESGIKLDKIGTSDRNTFKTRNDVFSRQGFEPNILKINKADEYLLCEEINKIIPNGIIEETITTYGSCIVGHPVEFYVVPNSFPFFTVVYSKRTSVGTR